MRTTVFGWRDLSKHSKIDALNLAMMARKLNSDISKFQISLNKFGIRYRLTKSKSHKFGEIVVLFDHIPDKNCDHLTTMYVKVYMGRVELDAVVKSYSKCDYIAYCSDIQNAMFTYFCNLVENDTRLLNTFKGVSFPDSITSEKYDKDKPLWDSCITSVHKGSIHPYMCEKNPVVVKNIRHDITQMPVILKLNEN